VIQEEYQTIDGEMVIHNELIEMPVRIGELEASE